MERIPSLNDPGGAIRPSMRIDYPLWQRDAVPGSRRLRRQRLLLTTRFKLNGG
jgi:hypothetical protein